MASLFQIVRDMRPRCPHCNHSLNLTEFAVSVFERILERAAQGDRVFVTRFGTFNAKYVGAQTIKSFNGPRTIEGRNVLRFRAAAHAKAAVNGKFERETDGEDQDQSGEKEPAAEQQTGAADPGGAVDVGSGVETGTPVDGEPKRRRRVRAGSN